MSQYTKKGNIFIAANQAVATTTVGLATTYTGLVVSNPVGSSVSLQLLRATLMQSLIQATQPEAFAIAYGFNAATNVTHTTPLTPYSARIGSGLTSVANADTSATLPTAPKYGEFLTNTPSATTNSTGIEFNFNDTTVIPPGGYVLFVTPAQASVAGMWFSLMWKEVLQTSN